jgi:hypothetical protein
MVRPLWKRKGFFVRGHGVTLPGRIPDAAHSWGYSSHLVGGILASSPAIGKVSKQKGPCQKARAPCLLAPLRGLISNHLPGTCSRGKSYSYWHSATANGHLTFGSRDLKSEKSIQKSASESHHITKGLSAALLNDEKDSPISCAAERDLKRD